jgi:hypothetical protein
MRSLAAALLAGCGFSVTATETGTQAEPDALDTATVPDSALPWCAGTIRSWITDFTTDPTTLDLDGDGTEDWVVRNDGTFPSSELIGGVWAAAPSPALDTRPMRDFTGRTRAFVTMRATAAGGTGATLWLNVDFSGGQFVPLWATLDEPGDQRFVLHNKTPINNDVHLATRTSLGSGLVDIELDIDPSTSTVTAIVEGVVLGSYTFTRIAANADRFATVIAYGTAAEFDLVRIETCE